jgi:hypothetical protein
MNTDFRSGMLLLSGNSRVAYHVISFPSSAGAEVKANYCHTYRCIELELKEIYEIKNHGRL